ncbi:unnamed protein product, partial [Anisakis simplex]|uniref:Uncharacterized protein n=1 Tax=Anisakis simplex TaxID=6269 RepID=A0A0M3JHE5_ANISI
MRAADIGEPPPIYWESVAPEHCANVTQMAQRETAPSAAANSAWASNSSSIPPGASGFLRHALCRFLEVVGFWRGTALFGGTFGSFKLSTGRSRTTGRWGAGDMAAARAGSAGPVGPGSSFLPNGQNCYQRCGGGQFVCLNADMRKLLHGAFMINSMILAVCFMVFDLEWRREVFNAKASCAWQSELLELFI